MTEKLEIAAGQSALRPATPPTSALGHDSDLEHHLREALIESRQRYKDLVEISSDFAWETDEHGRFTFVSPKGVLGWAPEALLGRPASEFLADPGETNVFLATAPVADVEIWFRRVDGGAARLGIVAVPIHDASGRRGARGIAHDLTGEREREVALARAQMRDRLFTHVVRATRDEIEPEAALAAAAKAAALALGAAGGIILRDTGTELAAAAHWGQPIDETALDAARRALAGADAITLASGDWHIIGHSARYRKAVEGAILLWRHRDDGGFPDLDRVTLADVADQLGGSIAQMAQHERIVALSRTDPLTGLMNRRAFFEEIERRLRRIDRGGRSAVLLYIDMDNFKLVNDNYGHRAGDEAIHALCRILRNHSRGGDLVARLGGDEFVVWIEGLDERGGKQRAELIQRACGSLAPLSGDSARPLGVSIGVAVVAPPHVEAPEQIVARADAAMYQAKQAGKGRVVVAPQNFPVPTC